MNEKGSVVIKIEDREKNVKKDSDEPPARRWLRDAWKFAVEDINRVIFSLKVGLAMLLVSLIILFRAPYEVLGISIIWSIITVAIMFEYTVGATFNRGFNRALGSLLAGFFAITVNQVAMSYGQIAEPYIIGFSIFCVGALTSFLKLHPSLSPYEYCFRVMLLTYCLIIITGYRLGNPIKTAMERLYSIAIGGIVAVLVNYLVLPIWAGDQLHRELFESFNAIANSLEECVEKYLADSGSSQPEFSQTVADDLVNEPAFRKCWEALNSSTKLEATANSAKWEPPHGRFRQFFYPWSEYVKVGAVLRQCAYKVMALHGCLHSEIQAPYNLRCAFKPEILNVTNQAAELLRNLAKDINNMKRSRQTNMLKIVHSSTERLQHSINMHFCLPTLSHEIQVSPPKLPQSQNLNTTNNDKQPNLVEKTSVVADSNHETMRKQRRKLYSWPSREVDDYQDGCVDAEMLQKMFAFESTAALSLANFTLLLIEFVAQLGRLVDATDLLTKMAKFKDDHES